MYVFFFKKYFCLIQNNGAFEYYDRGRIKSFTKLKLKIVAGNLASDFSNQLHKKIGVLQLFRVGTRYQTCVRCVCVRHWHNMHKFEQTKPAYYLDSSLFYPSYPLLLCDDFSCQGTFPFLSLYVLLNFYEFPLIYFIYGYSRWLCFFSFFVVLVVSLLCSSFLCFRVPPLFGPTEV